MAKKQQQQSVKSRLAKYPLVRLLVAAAIFAVLSWLGINYDVVSLLDQTTSLPAASQPAE